MKAILTQWVSENGRRPVLVCPIPMYQHIERSAPAKSYRARFEELPELKGVTVVDPLPRFWSESPSDRRRCRFEHDPHLTHYGHEVLDDALAQAMQRFLTKEKP